MSFLQLNSGSEKKLYNFPPDLPTWHFMKNYVLISLLFCLAASACRQESDNAIAINSNGIPVVYFEKITETGELKLSDIAKDLELVRLETNEDCMIDYVMRAHITDDYIIISTVSRGIYLFSREGKYIRQIAGTGNGPGEVNDPNRNLEYSESQNRLYATESWGFPSKIFSFGIENESYREIVLPQLSESALYSIRDVIPQNDSTLLVSTISGLNDSLNCRVMAISPEGKLLWQVNHSNAYGSYNVELYRINDMTYFCYTMAGDTLFSLEDKSLTPFVIFKSEKEQYSFNRENKPGDISYSYRVFNDELIIGSYQSITDFDESRPGRKRPVYGNSQSFVFNYKKNGAYLVDKFRDDFLGSDYIFYRPQMNGFCWRPFNAQDIFALNEKHQNDPDVDQEIKDRVQALAGEIDINDNPVLLIGKMK